MQPLLQVRDVATWFDTPRGYVRAVDGVSLDVEVGATVAVVGESGSGKSVLGRTIMNLLPPQAFHPGVSQVLFEGQDVRALPPLTAKHFWGTQVAMIFQDPMTSLNPVKRIGTQLTESMRYHLGMNKADAQARALDLLHQVGIPEPTRRLAQYPHELSGGMRQRVMIAIALSCEPKLLIADEPTTALDVTVQKQVLDLLDGLRHERNMAMLLITHDLGVVAGYSDRVAVMYAGRLLETMDTAQLVTSMRHPYTRGLLDSIPRIERPSHERLDAISGRPPSLVDLAPGCRFAPRCRFAQADCLTVEPELEAAEQRNQEYRCFYPVGTERGDSALAANLAAGVTAAGLTVGKAAA